MYVQISWLSYTATSGVRTVGRVLSVDPHRRPHLLVRQALPTGHLEQQDVRDVAQVADQAVCCDSNDLTTVICRSGRFGNCSIALTVQLTEACAGSPN